MQAITYREFLPALLGNGPTVPTAEDYNYSAGLDGSVTTAFAHAAFRYGHSTVSSQLQLIDDDGTSAGSIDVRHAFFNPSILADAPETVDRLLKGAATQVSEEVDLLMVDELRNFLFGPPGAGGLDLAALNIQRGRDVGMPDFRRLSISRSNFPVTEFSNLTSDANLAAALAAVYENDINNVDAWVGMLAEDHLPGSSVGRLLQFEIEHQFGRLRDGEHRTRAGSVDANRHCGGGGVMRPSSIGLAATIRVSLVSENGARKQIERHATFGSWHRFVRSPFVRTDCRPVGRFGVACWVLGFYLGCLDFVWISSGFCDLTRS